MLIKLVEDIERAIEHECYFSALALALTLPDICGKAEYPELKVGERYRKWCQKYICPIRSKEDPYSGDMPYLNEDMIFSLRNFFLHQGTPNVEPSSIWDDRCQIDHFKLKITDYKGWARGLQKCGYATDRAYANRLIKLIEDYDLYRYDTAKGRKKSDKQPAHISRYTVYRTNGLLYVYSNGKDCFDDIAASLGFRVKDLKKYNEVPEDFPLQKNDIVYLEKKKKKADKPNYDHVVQVGESMHSIAQKYGIQIKSLYKMNKKHKDYIPEEGDVLKLR